MSENPCPPRGVGPGAGGTRARPEPYTSVVRRPVEDAGSWGGPSPWASPRAYGVCRRIRHVASASAPEISLFWGGMQQGGRPNQAVPLCSRFRAATHRPAGRSQSNPTCQLRPLAPTGPYDSLPDRANSRPVFRCPWRAGVRGPDVLPARDRRMAFSASEPPRRQRGGGQSPGSDGRLAQGTYDRNSEKAKEVTNILLVCGGSRRG